MITVTAFMTASKNDATAVTSLMPVGKKPASAMVSFTTEIVSLATCAARDANASVSLAQGSASFICRHA
jgi:hypothetical protein